MKNILNKIHKFNLELNEYECSIIVNNEIIDEFSDEYFYDNYKTLNYNEFKKYKCGVCWDYVMYESAYFKKYFSDINYETYFFLIASDGYYSTHTFLLFYLNNNVYWFESSWKPYCGIHKFDSQQDALDYIFKELKNFYNPKIDKDDESFYCSYNAKSKLLNNISCQEYIDYILEQNLIKIK